MPNDVRVSVVTSMFRSSPFLEEFYARTVKAISAISSSYEIVFVNDGSPDDSLAVALRLRERDPRVRIVDLSRNFGHYRALMTGLAQARGELVFLIDCDLEEEPEWLLRFHEMLRRTGADVVYGVQSARKGGFLERVSGALFYLLLNRMLTDPIPRNVLTARLMTRRYVRALIQHQDREICLAALWVITGFEQRPLEVVKGSRPGSSYSLQSPGLGARERGHLVQQPTADLHLLHGRSRRHDLVARCARPRDSSHGRGHRSCRLRVADRLHLVTGRADAFQHRHRRRLPCQGLYRNQEPALHRNTR